MTKQFILGAAMVAAVLTVAVPAWAAQGGEGNNTDCNGQGNQNSPCAGNGGAGGAGGAGGTGIGVGIGKGGNAAAVGIGGNATAKSSSTSIGVVTGVVKGTQNYEGYSGAGASVHVEGGPRQAPSMGVSGDVSNITCFAHVGGGATTPFGGLNVVVPKMDPGCHKLRMHNALAARGFQAEALEILMQDSDVRAAFETVRAQRAAAVQTEMEAIPDLKLSGQHWGVLTPQEFSRREALTVSPAAIFEQPVRQIQDVQAN